MSEKENVKKLSLWQRGKLWYSLKSKGIIPEDCQFGAIDAMSVKKVEELRYKILCFKSENLQPLFCERNSQKLRKICEYSATRKLVIEYLDGAENPDDVRAFLSVSEIPLVWVEKYFIGRKPEEFFLPYLKAHDNLLPEEVVELLIEREQEELLVTYINLFKEGDYHNIPEDLLFESKMEKAKQAFAEKFVSDHGDENVIRYILKYGSDELATKLLQNNHLYSDEDFVLLFERKDPVLIDLVIDKEASDLRDLPTIVVNTLMESPYQGQILKYLENSGLSDEEEFALVHSNNSEAILFYLKKYNEPFYEVQTENYLFEHADEEILDYYRKNIRLPYTEERALVKDGTPEEISAYLKRNDLFDMNGLLLIEKGTPETIKCLIEKYEISTASEVALMRRNIPELTQLYLDKLAKAKERLSDLAEAVFVAEAEKGVSEYLHTHDFELSEEAEKALLYRGDVELSKEFCKDGRGFKEDIAEDFIRHAPQQLILSYLENDFVFPDAAMVALVKRRDAKLLQVCFDKGVDLCEEAEIALLKFGNVDLIKAYLTEDCPSQFVQTFSEGAETQLLDLNNEELFMFYINQTPLFESNEVKLVCGHDQKWIDAYIAKYDLSNDASSALAQKLYVKL